MRPRTRTLPSGAAPGRPRCSHRDDRRERGQRIPRHRFDPPPDGAALPTAPRGNAHAAAVERVGPDAVPAAVRHCAPVIREIAMHRWQRRGRAAASRSVSRDSARRRIDSAAKPPRMPCAAATGAYDRCTGCSSTRYCGPRRRGPARGPGHRSAPAWHRSPSSCSASAARTRPTAPPRAAARACTPVPATGLALASARARAARRRRSDCPARAASPTAPARRASCHGGANTDWSALPPFHCRETAAARPRHTRSVAANDYLEFRRQTPCGR